MNNDTSRMLMEHAAALLGWAASPVEVDVLGCRLWVAARLTEAGQHRLRNGQAAVTDPMTLRFVLATDTDFAAASAPVQIDGALSARRTWHGALTPLGGFVAFGPRVAIVPPAQARSSHLTMLALVEGFGVIAHYPAVDPLASPIPRPCGGHGWSEDGSGGDLQLVHPPDRRATGRGTWVHRLVEEHLFQAVLDARSSSSASVSASAATPRPRL